MWKPGRGLVTPCGLGGAATHWALAYFYPYLLLFLLTPTERSMLQHITPSMFQQLVERHYDDTRLATTLEELLTESQRLHDLALIAEREQNRREALTHG